MSQLQQKCLPAPANAAIVAIVAFGLLATTKSGLRSTNIMRPAAVDKAPQSSFNPFHPRSRG
ncbi:hypothetical protein BDW22DRAFT_1357073 [Trametopsis cervina]|nr:hypothetical protein BDW22DRAFT_1357073 [Trametopsis cervina]